jgi:hypothetical protein
MRSGGFVTRIVAAGAAVVMWTIPGVARQSDVSAMAMEVSGFGGEDLSLLDSPTSAIGSCCEWGSGIQSTTSSVDDYRPRKRMDARPAAAALRLSGTLASMLGPVNPFRVRGPSGGPPPA